MAEWNLPVTVYIDNKQHNIRNKCDYRVILDCIQALNDNDLTEEEQIKCALFVFYENIMEIKNYDVAVQEMMRIISGEQVGMNGNENSPRLMDWIFDFQKIAPPVNRILQYDVRTPERYTHWYTFLGAYSEIGDCQFANIVSIRSKIAKNKPLDKWEREYYNEHKNIIQLPEILTKEEQKLLSEPW